MLDVRGGGGAPNRVSVHVTQRAHIHIIPYLNISLQIFKASGVYDLKLAFLRSRNIIFYNRAISFYTLKH